MRRDEAALPAAGGACRAWPQKENNGYQAAREPNFLKVKEPIGKGTMSNVGRISYLPLLLLVVPFPSDTHPSSESTSCASLPVSRTNKQTQLSRPCI